MKKLLNQTKQKKGDIMQKLLNQTKKLLLFLSICIGSVFLTFTTQAQNTDYLTSLFSSCKDTSRGVDKSLRDVVINTVKATDMFADLAGPGRRWNFNVLIRDRSCAMQKLESMSDSYKIKAIQVTELTPELTLGGWEEGVLEQKLKGENGFCTDFYYKPEPPREFPPMLSRSKCNELKDQLLKSKYSSEQTFKSKTWTQDFLGGITGITKVEFYRDLFLFYRVYVVIHESNPNSAYVFIMVYSS